jgi:hypothetical protein
MTISFRSIRYGTNYNVGFFLDGTNSRYLLRCSVGDTVSLAWKVSPKQARAINELGNRDVRAISGTLSEPKTWEVYMQFVIVDKRHYLHEPRENSMSLGLGSSSIVLEAKNWQWEDIFKWLILGDVPKWANLDEEDE